MILIPFLTALVSFSAPVFPQLVFYAPWQGLDNIEGKYRKMTPIQGHTAQTGNELERTQLEGDLYCDKIISFLITQL